MTITISKKALILVAALILVVGGVVGGTVAWLTTSTDPVVNTFTVGDINITLTETPNQTYKIIPGTAIFKDPVVTVLADSEECYLFVKLDEANWSEHLTYAIADGWTKLEDGVYFRVVAATENDTSFNVIKDNKVNVSELLTKSEVEVLKNALPKLTITAYAVQHEGITDAATAWAKVKPSGN